MHTRRAILPDAQDIHDLISGYSHDGTLLPRTLPEICENVRDFVVLEDEGKIIGCGALHLYGTHLAEIRSITVAPWAQGKGGGGRLVKALMAEAKRHKVDCICLFTRKPDFFAGQGFSVAQRGDGTRQFAQVCDSPRTGGFSGQAAGMGAELRAGYFQLELFRR